MRYLLGLVLLFTFTCMNFSYAEVRVNIKESDGSPYFSPSTHASQAIAEAWVEKVKSQKGWDNTRTFEYTEIGRPDVTAERDAHRTKMRNHRTALRAMIADADDATVAELRVMVKRLLRHATRD